MDVEPVGNACHFGFDPLVTMQRPVGASRHQGFVIQPSNGDIELLAGLQTAVAQNQPVAAGQVHFPIEHNACAVSGTDGRGQAYRRQHFFHNGLLSAGEDAYRVTHLRDARSHTAPINTASLAGGGTVVELLDPLHCKGELCLFIAGGDWDVFQQAKEAWSAVATPIGQGADHIPTFERRHGHHGVDIDSRFVGKTL